MSHKRNRGNQVKNQKRIRKNIEILKAFEQQIKKENGK